MPSQLTVIIIVNNYKEKFTEKYKIVSGEAKGKAQDTFSVTTIGYVSDNISVMNEGTNIETISDNLFNRRDALEADKISINNDFASPHT
ncbi:13536_t:CDS:2 [Entrophospora sp. SA101]|nr:13536_t:CDS:2 [Entrophospora sp. SA101]